MFPAHVFDRELHFFVHMFQCLGICLPYVMFRFSFYLIFIYYVGYSCCSRLMPQYAYGASKKGNKNQPFYRFGASLIIVFFIYLQYFGIIHYCLL